MKAKEYIQKNGWDYAIKFANYDSSIGGDKCELDGDEFDDLKKFTDAYELVRSKDGISQCKFWISMMDGCDHVQARVDELKQAISLVEEVENYNEKTKEGDPS